MKLIFEPHNGFGGDDPNGEPWPFGYISEGPGKPVFELHACLATTGQMFEAIEQMLGHQQRPEGSPK